MGRKSKYIESCNGTKFDRNDVIEMVRNMRKRVVKAEIAGSPIPFDGFGKMVDHICGIITDGCPMCGTDMVRNYDGKRQTNISPTCDRKTPNSGYVIGNVQVICHSCNVAKDSRTEKQFWYLVSRSLTHLPQDMVNEMLQSEAGKKAVASFKPGE